MHNPISTPKLFELFYKSGLLQDNGNYGAVDLIRAMDDYEQMRFNSVQFKEFVLYSGKIPSAYMSMRGIGRNVWIMQQHCSIIKGLGIKILIDVMEFVMSSDEVEYVIGFYTNGDNQATRIWSTVLDLFGNKNLCDLEVYEYSKGQLSPKSDNHTPLFSGALSGPFIKPNPFFARPTGVANQDGKEYSAILFKVCDESRDLFKSLFALAT